MSGSKSRSKTGYTLFILLAFWVYLLIGSLLYFVIETPSYYRSNQPSITINSTFCQRLVDAVQSNLGYNTSGTFVENETNNNIGYWSTIFKKYCDNLTFGNTTNSSSDNIDPSWEYSSALFLCMSLLTTIGYGDFSPKSDGGKVFVIFYGFIGIPICGLCLAATSNYFSNAFLRLYNRYPKLQEKTKYSILIATIGFLLPGLAVFLLIPSAIIMAIEGWDYLDATYFGFITLTTIGFGDIVPAMEAGQNWLWVYRLCLFIWVFLGIAYWAIIIGFITKALKSNELKQRWRRTSATITRQASDLRRAMENISIPPLTPKYRDTFVSLKSKSAFDFAFNLGSSLSNIKNNSGTKPDLGAQSMMDLSVTSLSQQHPLTLDQLNTKVDNEEISTRSDEYLNRSTLVNCHSSDSGFDDDENTRDKSIEIVTLKSDRGRGISFTTSAKSRASSVSSIITSAKLQDEAVNKGRNLSIVPENVSPSQNLQVYFYRPDMIWQTFGVLKNTWAWGVVSSLGNNVRKVLDWGTPRFLSRNQQNQTASSPEMGTSVPTNGGSRQLQDLLIEAMIILQEAELEGLDPTE